MPNSDALDAGHNGIGNYMDRHVEVETHSNGTRTMLGQLAEGMVKSARSLRVTEELLWLSGRLPQFEFTEFLAQFAHNPAMLEYFAAEFGYEALRRAQKAIDRLPALLRIVAESAPPDRSAKYLESAATCFLYGFDRECVTMCRGAVEVLVEERFPDVHGVNLGPTVIALRDTKRLDGGIAKDMLDINAQAREVLHDEPGRISPDAEKCLFLLGRILRRMFPAERPPTPP